MVRIWCKPIPITGVAVYAPANPLSDQSSALQATDEFYKALQEICNKVAKGDMLLIIDALNARMSFEHNCSVSDVVARHAVDRQNSNGICWTMCSSIGSSGQAFMILIRP
jgi:hypothetical protein